uniref:Protein tyrosine phosphatase receptor type Nb n=1 Tax=Poecilia mexicana TaxID=48701 RepID=A0A3B3X0L7_9TELE
ICPRGQLCSDDGLFGQCGAPDQKPVRYRVSSPVLLRLQEILKDLMVQGLTWNDELTQSIIKPLRDPLTKPELMQQYLDYLVLDPYHQVRAGSPHPPVAVAGADPLSVLQNQNQEQRSLNSLDQNPTFQRGDALDRDRLLLQDLLSLYLSSSPALPRHRGAPAAGSSLLPDLDFPLDYSQDYNSQDPQLKKQELDVLSGLDGLLIDWLSHQSGVYLEFLIFLYAVLPVDTWMMSSVAGQNFLEPETGLKVLQSGAEQTEEGKSSLPLATRVQPGSRWVFATLVSMACIGGILVAAMTIACLRRHAHRLAAKKLGLGPDGGSFTHQEYQDLCRQHMASKGAFGRLEAAALGAVGGAGSATGAGAGAVGGAGVAGGVGPDSRVSSVSSQFSDGAQPSPSSHSSTPSWCEEPAQANMDISTGHMILAYMEDHLRNKDRLLKEWAALCSYQAEPSAVSVAQSDANAKKNRCPDSVPYDHSRVKLKADSNPSRSDYVNASTIIEHDPRMPAYIATQGPLPHTISDFWQMVWENGCTVIVMMTALVEDGEKQCDRYWPDEGSSLYHIYEVNLVSEHIWCNDFLVRSFYLKNVQTQETRTLTQFHFLSWPAQGIPTSTRPLLDFRRKVNKCYRGRSCPIIVHCSDGTGRTGTYILIDMVLNRMAKGVKEIDIAATLEHVRDQRPGMVRTKDQFEFALTAVAEEVNAILKALPQ